LASASTWAESVHDANKISIAGTVIRKSAFILKQQKVTD
jgi:hypothetical protein